MSQAHRSPGAHWSAASHVRTQRPRQQVPPGHSPAAAQARVQMSPVRTSGTCGDAHVSPPQSVAGHAA